ncbi:four-carbon acid sugar kinase family protein [Halalkalibacter sp. APA_J-10(15)]|uniref:four-carbon acid sugar kinase family protein n=1 Tax=Halalkalibacter sp. APA_J-10(15) TaxID=2933805 RepID=UPI001FF57509|nr:four-carbon acid sugar kinase family protein [Halalkalibacter sp. APA_J-10(15)]MCK0470144.1 four-carbon acid sugar kinase family protein [Halalkalibacter sp. APA_J-10(15)]
MKALIIADDFTGANDAGVQFAKKQLTTSVLMHENVSLSKHIEVLVVDTDSRSSQRHVAYEKVQSALKLAKQYEFDTIYKKIDSTMRGNVGSELDALLDNSDAKFIIIAPSYPDNHRFVKNGHIFVEDTPLEETYFARDVSTPIHSSSIKALIEHSSNRLTDMITLEDLYLDKEAFHKKLALLRENGVEYMICDAETNAHLKTLFQYMNHYAEPFIWCGSAGMAEQLADHLATEKVSDLAKEGSRDERILFAVGSVHERTRDQLEHLLAHSNIKGIELNTTSLLHSKELKQQTIHQAYKEAIHLLQEHTNIVLYTSAAPEDIQSSREIGKKRNLSSVQVSDYISSSIGELVRMIIEDISIERALFTGGDTAKKSGGAYRIKPIPPIR